MNDAIKFYKIKLIKKLLLCTEQIRNELFNELTVHATNPIIVKRRLRMIRHVNLYQNQLIEKIQNFETDNIDDLNKIDFKNNIKYIIHRSA